MESGDGIIADRGWTCANWLGRKGVILITCWFLYCKQQMNIHKLVESVSIARMRIHIESCMGRIKQWQLLRQTVALAYWNIVSDLFQESGRVGFFWSPLIEHE